MTTPAQTVRTEPRCLPISFKPEMVRAVLAGTKTQTRRICTDALDHGEWAGGVHPDGARSGWIAWWPGNVGPEETARLYPGADGFRCPYGAPGDRLWVRETWQYADWTEDGMPFIRYQADGKKILHERTPADWADRLTETWAKLSEASNYDFDNRAADRRWRPSIFLPRWASRIDLEVTEVRVQRLQEISEEDARAEGVQVGADGFEYSLPTGSVITGARGAFARLWDSINAKRGYGWAENPWVWAISFRRLSP